MKNLLSNQDTQALFDILVKQLGVKQSQLTPDARIKEDLGADSLTIMEIIMAIEDQFHVSIPDEEWENVSTVGDTFKTLAKYLASRSVETCEQR